MLVAVATGRDPTAMRGIFQSVFIVGRLRPPLDCLPDDKNPFIRFICGRLYQRGGFAYIG